MSLPADIAAPLTAGLCSVLGVLIQRGRHETAQRFESVSSHLEALEERLEQMDARQRTDDTAIAVVQRDVESLREGMRGRVRRGLWVVAAMAATWLLVGGCSNG